MSILTKSKIKPLNQTCPFGRNPSKISYKNPDMLKKYISPRGRILQREYTGVSDKCQRKLAQEIKRARYLALLPFVNYEAAAQ